MITEAHHNAIDFGDGKVESRIIYGDGSTGPFLEVEVTNDSGDRSRMHLERYEVEDVAQWLRDCAEGDERWTRQ